MEGELTFVFVYDPYPHWYSYLGHPVVGPLAAMGCAVLALLVAANIRIRKAPLSYWSRATTQPPLMSPFAMSIWMRRLGCLGLLWGSAFGLWDMVQTFFHIVRRSASWFASDIAGDLGMAVVNIFWGLIFCIGAVALSWVVDLSITGKLKRLGKDSHDEN